MKKNKEILVKSVVENFCKQCDTSDCKFNELEGAICEVEGKFAKHVEDFSKLTGTFMENLKVKVKNANDWIAEVQEKARTKDGIVLEAKSNVDGGKVEIKIKNENGKLKVSCNI